MRETEKDGNCCLPCRNKTIFRHMAKLSARANIDIVYIRDLYTTIYTSYIYIYIDI